MDACRRARASGRATNPLSLSKRLSKSPEHALHDPLRMRRSRTRHGFLEAEHVRLRRARRAIRRGPGHGGICQLQDDAYEYHDKESELVERELCGGVCSSVCDTLLKVSATGEGYHRREGLGAEAREWTCEKKKIIWFAHELIKTKRHHVHRSRPFQRCTCPPAAFAHDAWHAHADAGVPRFGQPAVLQVTRIVASPVWTYSYSRLFDWACCAAGAPGRMRRAGNPALAMAAGSLPSSFV